MRTRAGVGSITVIARASDLAGRAGLYLLLSSGLFYFTYKFYQPDFGGTDYYKYYPTYLSPLNLHAAPSPFVYRQLSALATNLVYRFGPYYDIPISFSAPGLDQRVFFAALLTNFLALAGCAVAASMASERLSPGAPPSVALFAGALCYLEFFAQACGMGPITDGLAWLLMAVGFLGYVNRSALTMVIVLALSVVERETIPVMLGVIAGVHLVMSPKQRRFDAVVIGLCVAAFAAYLCMRTIWAPVAGHAAQTQIGTMLRPFTHPRMWLTKDVLFQGFLSQNLLILLGVMAVWRRFGRGRRSPALSAQTEQLIVGVFAAAAVLLVMTVAASTNIGRIIAMLTPATAALLALAMFGDGRAPAAVASPRAAASS
jgi:hypothetical protein